jgi:ADP-ribosyl-[dinitrogen reductase] hydrolase
MTHITLDDAARDRALGAYLGLAVGDALGGPVEFMTAGEIRHKYGVHCRMTGGGWLDLKPGQVTDDTEMALCVGRAILKTGGWDAKAVAEEFAAWLRTVPADVGNTCRRGIRRYIVDGSVAAPYNEGDAGNGACMRNVAVALATLGAPDAYNAWTVEQCHITHNHPMSDDATVALGRMVQHLILDGGMHACREEARWLIGRHPAFRFDHYNGLCTAYIVDTVRTVLYHFFMTDSVRACVIETVNIGGDADTAGALAGMLAGATYGAKNIPKPWLAKLDHTVQREIEDQVDALLEVAGFPAPDPKEQRKARR